MCKVDNFLVRPTSRVTETPKNYWREKKKRENKTQKTNKYAHKMKLFLPNPSFTSLIVRNSSFNLYSYEFFGVRLGKKGKWCLFMPFAAEAIYTQKNLARLVRPIFNTSASRF